MVAPTRTATTLTTVPIPMITGLPLTERRGLSVVSCSGAAFGGREPRRRTIDLEGLDPMTRSLVSLRAAALSDAPQLAELWSDVLRRTGPEDQVADLEAVLARVEGNARRADRGRGVRRRRSPARCTCRPPRCPRSTASRSCAPSSPHVLPRLPAARHRQRADGHRRLLGRGARHRPRRHRGRRRLARRQPLHGAHRARALRRAPGRRPPTRCAPGSPRSAGRPTPPAAVSSPRCSPPAARCAARAPRREQLIRPRQGGCRRTAPGASARR